MKVAGTGRQRAKAWLSGLPQAAAFSSLPWLAVFLAETFGGAPLQSFMVDRGMIVVAFHSAVVYLCFIFLTTLLSVFASLLVSRTGAVSPDGAAQRVSSLTMISWLTLFIFAVILKFSTALSSAPLPAFILGIPVIGVILVLGGLIVLFGIIPRVELRKNSLFILAALGIAFWLLVTLRFQSPNTWPLDLAVYASIAIAQTGILIKNTASLAKRIPFRWLQKNIIILLFALGFPILSLVANHLIHQSRFQAAADGSSLAKPNVVILLADSVRADHCSVYGYGRETLKHLGEELGPGWTVFKNASSQATSTIPSVKALFSSRPASSWGSIAFSKPPPRRTFTMAEAFLAAGYATACFSAVEQVGGGAFEEGFQEFLSWSGYQQARKSLAIRSILCRGDYLRIFRWTRPTRTHAPDGKIILNLAEKWARAKKDEPFFLYLHLADPHWPYYNHDLGMIPEPYRPYMDKLIYVDLLGVESPGEAAAFRNTPEFMNLIGRYDEEIRYTDEIAHQLMNFMKQSGLWENTLFIFTADHGEELLDHDRFSHGHDIWEELTHIPLVIKWPASPSFSSVPENVEARVGLIDLFPTLADYLELPAGTQPFEGASLRQILEAANISGTARPLFSESIDGEVIRGAFWEGTGKARVEYATDISPLESSVASVYDLKRDPQEKTPIAADDPAAADILSRARGRLQEIWKSWPDRGAPRSKQKTKKEPGKKSALEKLKSLGYIK